jgi:hypothetical protein
MNKRKEIGETLFGRWSPFTYEYSFLTDQRWLIDKRTGQRKLVNEGFLCKVRHRLLNHFGEDEVVSMFEDYMRQP